MYRTSWNWSFVFLAFLIPSVFFLAGCESQESADQAGYAASPQAAFTPDPDRGARLFAANCASCHGQGGRGTEQGPPLMHRIYEPGHHDDLSFYRAVAIGSHQHHWNFGDMPPVAGISPEDTSHIIAYVRQEQRRVGIK